jgi:DNA primase
LAEPEEAETASQRQSRSVDLIRARLDLPTFIARHIGRTPVAFRRVGGMLVCPCPLPEETNDDAWLCVDPVAQIWKCTGCRDGGDVSAFAHSYFGLQGRALWAFLGREAGLTFDPWPTHD